MSRRAAAVLTAMVIWGAAGAAPALADRSPANCGTNGLDLTISTDKTTVHNGDVVTYTVSIQNDKAGSCDISGATVTFALPGADGQPDRAHAQTLVPSAANPTQNYPAGTHEKLLGTFTYAVEVNPGVTTITPEGVAHGDLHISVNNGRADISKTLNSDVTNPKLTLDKVGSITAGLAPQNVTYTYLVRNDSLTPVAMQNVVVRDNLCANATYVGGDNGDGLLTNGETYTFTCSMLHQAPGVYTNTAQACADSTFPGEPTPHVCSNPDTWTVTLTKPAGAVKGAQAANPSQRACVSVPTHLGLRARELTRVRVHVALNGKDIAGSVVKIRGVGISRSKKTGKHGIVTFRVRAKRSGRLTVSSDHCIPAAKISVKPARRVVSPALPQVTG